MDVFQVLDEKGFFVALFAEGIEFRILGAHELERVQNRVALSHRERYDTQCLVRALPRVREHLLGHGLGLLRVIALLAALVFAIDQSEAQPSGRTDAVRARWADETVVIELVVRDRDQRRMLRAVVPSQHPAGHPARFA